MLTCHVQKFVVILHPVFELQQYKLFIELELWLKIMSETGSRNSVVQELVGVVQSKSHRNTQHIFVSFYSGYLIWYTFLWALSILSLLDMYLTQWYPITTQLNVTQSCIHIYENDTLWTDKLQLIPCPHGWPMIEVSIVSTVKCRYNAVFGVQEIDRVIAVTAL